MKTNKVYMSAILSCIVCGHLSAQDVENVNIGTSVSTASGSAHSSIDAPASISVIKKEDLEQKPYRDLAEALQDVPGISIDADRGKTGTLSISIRGMPAEYTLILIDGRRQGVSSDISTRNQSNEATSGFIPPLSAIERIEIIRGPMSTLYGSDAIGGVVNIITKKVGDKWGANLSLGSSLNETNTFGNTYQANLYMAGPLIKDKLGLTLRYRHFYREDGSNIWTRNDGTTTSSYTGAPTNTYGIGGKLDYIINPQNSVFLDIDYTKQSFDNEGSAIGNILVWNPATTTSGYYRGGYKDGIINFERSAVALGHSGDYDLGRWKSSLTYTSISNDGRYVTGKPADIPQAGTPRDIQGSDIVADTRFVAPIGESNVLNVGAEYKYMYYRDRASEPDSFSQNSIAVFAEDEWSIFDPLSLTLGVRYNYHEVFGSNISPRAYLVYKLLDTLSIKGGVSTGYKAPYTNELVNTVTGYGSQGRQPWYGNTELTPETSVNYEIGAYFDNEYVGASVGIFRSDFSDKISTRSITDGQTIAPGVICDAGDYGGSSCSQRINISSAYSQGIETMLTIKPIYGVGLDMGYTYTDTEQTSGSSKGAPLTNIAKHALNAKLSYTYKDFGAYVRGEFRGGRVHASAVTGTQQEAYRQALGGIYYKDYTILSLGASYKFTEGIRLHAGIYNLANQSFVDYEKVVNTTYVNRYNLIQEQRRYFVNLSLDF